MHPSAVLHLPRSQLEKQFRLCDSCERHVSQVLTEKKKMVLGSKFLNFVVKSAALLKQPHFNHLARVQQQRRLQRYQSLMCWLTLINTLCLLCSMQPATRNQFTSVLGEMLGKALHFLYSHALTLWHVLAHYVQQLLADQPSVDKVCLYASTLGKLLLYSGGVSQGQAQQATFASCYSCLYPYAMLALSFLHNIRDGLKFSRFTGLLLMWSVYAEGTLAQKVPLEGNTLLVSAGEGGAMGGGKATAINFTFSLQLIGNLVTVLLLVSNRGQSLLQMAHNDSVGDSFHRLCADECINDDETISLLSQQLSCSAASTSHNHNHNNNNNLGHSQRATRGIPSPTQSPQLVAPSVLSLDSLRLSSQRTLASPIPSYRTLLPCYDQQQQHHHQQLGAWQTAAAPSVAPTGYGWQQQGVAPASVYERRRAVPQQQQQQHLRQSLLLPSRLEQRNGEVSAWVHATATCNSPLTDLLEQPSTTSLLQQQQQQQLSRTSSQSSGFESQTGNNNGAGAATGAVGFWGNVQHQQQQLQLQAPTVVTSDYGWGDASQRGLRIPAPLPSPYSTQSEMGFGRVGSVATAQSQQQQQHELRPGDLLRKWMDRNAVGMPMTNG